MLKKILGFLLVIYALILIGIFLFQRNLVFSPDNSPISVPNEDIKEVILKTENNESLYNWHSITKDTNIVILFMHGNAGNIATKINKLETFKTLGFDVFLLGYPGYGESSGSPSEKNFVHAAKQGFDYLKSLGYANNKIVVYGESLGTAVAIQLAATIEARSVILEAPMTSIQEIAAEQYPFIPIKWLIKDPFLSINHIEQVDEPVLIIHGDMDEAIPFQHGQRLYEAIKTSKYFHKVKGGGHNNLYDFNIDGVLELFINTNQI